MKLLLSTLSLVLAVASLRLSVEVGDRLWVGSFRGDRIAVLAAP